MVRVPQWLEEENQCLELVGRWTAQFQLGLIALAVGAVTWVGPRDEEGKPARSPPEEVELFAAIDAGQVSVKLDSERIPSSGTVMVENKTDRPPGGATARGVCRGSGACHNLKPGWTLGEDEAAVMTPADMVEPGPLAAAGIGGGWGGGGWGGGWGGGARNIHAPKVAHL